MLFLVLALGAAHGVQFPAAASGSGRAASVGSAAAHSSWVPPSPPWRSALLRSPRLEATPTSYLLLARASSAPRRTRLLAPTRIPSIIPAARAPSHSSTLSSVPISWPKWLEAAAVASLQTTSSQPWWMGASRSRSTSLPRVGLRTLSDTLKRRTGKRASDSHVTATFGQSSNCNNNNNNNKERGHPIRT